MKIVVESKIQTYGEIFGSVDLRSAVLASINFKEERDLLGEIINLAGNYQRGIKVGKIEELHPNQITEVEKHLGQSHDCSTTGFLHIGRAFFQRVDARELESAQQYRQVTFDKLLDLRIENKPGRPILKDAIILPGLSSQKMAFQVAVEAGIPLGRVEVTDFANTEMKVGVLDSVRGKNVFIVQPFGYDSSRQLQTLKLLMNAVKLAGAEEINLVLPSFPFARQDRKPSHIRAPISAQVVASDLVHEGMDRLITLEIHAQQIVGFFEKRPVDNLLGIPLATREAIRDYHDDRIVLAYPDYGMSKRAKDDGHSTIIQNQLGRIVPKIELRKDRPDTNKSDIEILGDKSAIPGATVLLPDDLIDTAGTNLSGAHALRDAGAAKVIVAAAHGVMSIDAIERLKYERAKDGSRLIERVYVTDSLPLYKSPYNVETGEEVIKVVSSAGLLGEAVRRIGEKNGDSLRELFEQQTYYHL